jgi:hypothetical protein
MDSASDSMIPAPCPNCGSTLVENYCAHCGQRQKTAHVMREFVREVADDQFGIDAKFPRTMRALFFKPGLLTREYMDGRVARYIPPLRLYLLSSILFFVLLSFLSRQTDWAEDAANDMKNQIYADTIAKLRARGLDTMKIVHQQRTGIWIQPGGDKNWVENISVNLPWKWLDNKVETNMRALAALPPAAALRRIVDTTLEELPKVMFLLLPVFALLMKLLYVRRKRYYIEHFIFALHWHAFAFLLFCIFIVIRADWLAIAVLASIAIYTFLAMKRVYGQGVFKTALKWLVLGYVYTVLLCIGLVFALIWAFASTAPA